jgi:hypothetical protein
MVVSGLQFIVGIASLVCFVMVLVKMFQNGQTGLAIACILLLFVCGIGALVTFVMGWINSAKWNIKNIMLAWTGCWVLGIILAIVGAIVAPTVTVTTTPNFPSTPMKR